MLNCEKNRWERTSIPPPKTLLTCLLRNPGSAPAIHIAMMSSVNTAQINVRKFDQKLQSPCFFSGDESRCIAFIYFKLRQHGQVASFSL